MKKLFLACTISLAILAQSYDAWAAPKERVRVRSDGNIIDIDGNVIAVPNTTDKRNDQYQRYYSKLADGVPNRESDFYIISDPNAGYVKKDLVPKPEPDPMKSPAMQMIPEVKLSGKKKAPPEQKAVGNNDKTGIQVETDPNKAFYDNLPNSGVNAGSSGGGVYE